MHTLTYSAVMQAVVNRVYACLCNRRFMLRLLSYVCVVYEQIECEDTHSVEIQQHQQDHTAARQHSNTPVVSLLHARSEVCSTAELCKLRRSATTSK
jgi:hypothetical protein